MTQLLPWLEPLELAGRIDEPYWVLLYSSARTGYSGRYSYLAHGLRERVESNDFSDFEQKLTNRSDGYDNTWWGYLGYGLKDCLEKLAPDQPSWLSLPHLCMMQFHTIYRFDHEERTLTRWSDAPNHLLPEPRMATDIYPHVVSLRSNMSRDAYLEKAAHVIECIRRGDLYQANLTRKFQGRFSDAPDGFAVFKKLSAVSPAPYSAFMRLGEHSILSSSPELFLHVDAQGHMRTRPIKGTSARYADLNLDNQSRDTLAASAKDHAENLMIVDLMRNDFSRACIPGSVRSENLFEVTSHATIHHMSSTVTGRKRHDCSTIQAVKNCFPPGSMTGAPKIRAMNLCSALEKQERSVYSGAIGWFGGDGSCELSVIIRTLILKGHDFEFQVGGGIVADSTPERELGELMEKSRGILGALGITMERLAAL